MKPNPSIISRFTAFAVLLMFVAITCRAAPPSNLVQAELLADVATIKPGTPLTVAVRFRIHDGWHIYWKFPGASGLATKVTWKLPAGFTAGELQFPIPQRIVAPGDIVNYGYEQEVLLLTTITPPKDLQPDQTIDLNADVSWLVCEKACIPGKASLKLSILTAVDAPVANGDQFSKWKGALPTRIDKGFSIKPGEGDTLVASVTLPSPATDVQWFPAPPAGSGIADLATKRDAAASSLSFSILQPPKEFKPIEFVVAYTDSNGKRQGVEFTVDLPPAK